MRNWGPNDELGVRALQQRVSCMGGQEHLFRVTVPHDMAPQLSCMVPIPIKFAGEAGLAKQKLLGGGCLLCSFYQQFLPLGSDTYLR